MQSENHLSLIESSWYLDNERESANECPYTFYLPSQAVLDQLKTGDLVKLRFNIKDPSEASAERMWVEIAEIQDDQFTGHLTNEPVYIRDLVVGDVINFSAQHILDTPYDDPTNPVEQYIDGCFVTNRVLLDCEKIGYLYRSESMGEPNGMKDSGWMIMTGTETQEYLDESSNLQYVSLGSVLNVDDSILDLLTAPVGSAFFWDEALQRFIEEKDEN